MSPRCLLGPPEMSEHFLTLPHMTSSTSLGWMFSKVVAAQHLPSEVWVFRQHLLEKSVGAALMLGGNWFSILGT